MASADVQPNLTTRTIAARRAGTPAPLAPTISSDYALPQRHGGGKRGGGPDDVELVSQNVRTRAGRGSSALAEPRPAVTPGLFEPGFGGTDGAS
jgi:hypothetical protein